MQVAFTHAAHFTVIVCVIRTTNHFTRSNACLLLCFSPSSSAPSMDPDSVRRVLRSLDTAAAQNIRWHQFAVNRVVGANRHSLRDVLTMTTSRDKPLSVVPTVGNGWFPFS